MISEATLGVTVDPLGRELSDVAFALRQSTVEIRTRGTGVGSGIVWNSTGTIVTNAHVTRADRAICQRRRYLESDGAVRHGSNA